MQVSDRGAGTELSVILPVRVANTTLEILLDSGAGPSVIDLRTIREWASSGEYYTGKWERCMVWAKNADLKEGPAQEVWLH